MMMMIMMMLLMVWIGVQMDCQMRAALSLFPLRFFQVDFSHELAKLLAWPELSLLVSDVTKFLLFSPLLLISYHFEMVVNLS
jgi:hypothetical protein